MWEEHSLPAEALPVGVLAEDIDWQIGSLGSAIVPSKRQEPAIVPSKRQGPGMLIHAIKWWVLWSPRSHPTLFPWGLGHYSLWLMT